MSKHSFHNIRNFLINFRNRNGLYVFFAIITNKIFAFILSVVVMKQLTTTDFGLVAYAYNIISFVVPFAGFGIFQSLSRFGPIQPAQFAKKQLFRFVFARGLAASAILALLVVLFATIIPLSLPESYPYLALISLMVISLFTYEMVKIYYRIYHLNKIFSIIEIAQSGLLLVSGIVLTYFWGGLGYIFALVACPLVVSIFIIVRNKLLTGAPQKHYTREQKKSFWYYGLYTSLGGVSSQLIYSIDILSIGYLIKDANSIALYKAASLIPFALMFIPSGVMQTDIIKITQEYRNKVFLERYAANYIKLFGFISIFVYILLVFLAPSLMRFLGSDYGAATHLIPTFALGLMGAFVFRIPFGNIITAIGLAKRNTQISMAVVVLDVILNYFFIKKYGIIGAAYTTSLLLWVAGLLSYWVFRRYLETL